MSVLLKTMFEDPKRRILKDVFGFDDFRPGQATRWKPCWPAAMS